MTKQTLVKVCVSVIVVLAIVGAYFYPKYSLRVSGVPSPSGSTFGNALEASITWQPATGATTTSILNTSTQDRYIKSEQYMCTGLGSSVTGYTGGGLTSSGWLIDSATTSAANTEIIIPATVGFLQSQVIATTSSYGSFLSTSTPEVGGGSPLTDRYRIWNAGSYLTFEVNATNTATCTIGASYLGS